MENEKLIYKRMSDYVYFDVFKGLGSMKKHQEAMNFLDIHRTPESLLEYFSECSNQKYYNTLKSYTNK